MTEATDFRFESAYRGESAHTPDTYSRHRRFKIAFEDGPAAGSEGYVTSFVIGHFWFIVAGFADVEMFNAFRACADEFFSHRHLRPLTRFWPPDTDDEGSANAVAPQAFPPGPEATKAMCEAVSSGPKKLWVIVNGVKHEINFQALPSRPTDPYRSRSGKR